MAANEEKKEDIPTPSLSKILLEYTKYTVFYRRQVINDSHQRILVRVVNPVLTRISRFDDRFHAGELDAGSCYVGLQHTKQYEFDCVVRLHNLTSDKSLGKHDERTCTSIFLDSSACDNPYINKLPGYGFLVVDESKTLLHNLTSDRNDHVHSEQLVENERFLCPKKVTSVFFKGVYRAVQELKDEQFWEEEPSVFEVNISRQGPAITLTAYLTGEVFTVHLLLGIPFTSNWPETLRKWGPASAVRPNPWLTSPLMNKVMEDFIVFPGQTPEQEDQRLWAMCFYCSEKKLCQITEQNSFTIHREARFVLEALCAENEDAFHPINPRLLRMIFLHQCMQFPREEDWMPKKLGRAFVDMFLAIISSTKSGSLSHFFIPQLDMFGHLTKADLKRVSRHLKAILNDIVENPSTTNFLPQKKKRKKKEGGIVKAV